MAVPVKSPLTLDGAIAGSSAVTITSAAAQPITLKPGSNVAIDGTNSDNPYILKQGATKDCNLLIQKATATGWVVFRFNPSVGPDASHYAWDFGSDSNTHLFWAYTDNVTESHMMDFIAGTGVGFNGKNPPTYAVDVNGDTNTSGVFRCGGTAGVTHAAGAPTSLTTAGGLVTAFSTSDERQKRDIEPFRSGLDALREVQPIKFWWNEETCEVKSDHAWIGFSAQNVQKTIPEAVPATLANGMLDFNPFGVLAVAVNAIKELEAKLAACEARVRKLEARIK